MLLLGLEVPLFMVMLFHDYSISRFLDHKALKIKQKDYEDYFIKRYGSGETLPKSSYVPLTFEERHKQNLLKLCTNYNRSAKWLPQYHLNKRRVKNYEQKIEFQYLGFRRQSENPKPVRVEMIRCTEDYALIAAENGWTGFVLQKDPKPDEKERLGIPSSATLFYLYTKFRYGNKVAVPKESPTGNDRAPSRGAKTRSPKSFFGRLFG